MANIRSSAKRARQTGKRTLDNRRVLSNIRTRLKRFRAAVAEKNKDVVSKEYRTAVSALDRAVKHGRIHRNKANRQKSALTRATKSLA